MANCLVAPSVFHHSPLPKLPHTMARVAKERLSVANAQAIMDAQDARLSDIGASWHLAFTQRGESVVKTYDTLVITLPAATQAINARHSNDNVSILLREVLLVLYALSNCRGFSFRDNAVFWESVWPLSYTGHYTRFQVLPVWKPSRAFPRVVVYCSHQAIEGFQRKVFDVFVPARHNELSQATQSMLGALRPFSIEEQEPIEVVVRLALEKTANDTSDLLAYVATHLVDIDEAREGSPLQLTGLELVGRRRDSGRGFEGLQTIHLSPLRALVASLPESMTISLRFARSDQVTQCYQRLEVAGLVSFFKNVCGFQGSEFAGRLEVLDLVKAFNTRSKSPELGSLCSLLPTTTTLREVRVSIVATTDWLWLAYAIFHPKSRLSSWRVLALYVEWTTQVSSPAAWLAVDKLVQAGATSMAVKNMLDEREEEPRNTSDIGARSRRVIRRTATVLKRTTVFKSDRIRRLITLARGETIEICDNSTTAHAVGIAEADSDFIAVFVPGHWFGYALRSCLSSISETEELEPLTSCITSLHVADVNHYNGWVPHDAEAGIVHLFGPSLKHLRVDGPDWFQQHGFSREMPLLESINCCWFFPAMTSCDDFAALPKLRALSVTCDASHVEQCLRSLLFPCRGTLRELHFHVTMSTNNTLSVNSVLKQCLDCLQLAHLEVVVTALPVSFGFRELQPFVDLDGISTNSDVDSAKLAFLSAVHLAQADAGVGFDALAQLDSMLIRIVFDFCGLQLESLTIFEDVNHTFRTLSAHETEIAGNAWFKA